MSVHRVMGIETEYGVFAPLDPEANPQALSNLTVAAYRAASARRGQELRTRWDYHGEDPLRDARGYDVPRQLARPEELTHEISHAVPNVVLPNGGRLYVDHAHPEYSTPEFTTPRDGIVWDRAGELIAQRAIEEMRQMDEGNSTGTASSGPAANNSQPGVVLYKNNSDGKGASYGCHENYLVDRSVDFEDLVHGLVPFLVTRQIFCGAGQVGIGPKSEEPGYQISQRADHIERLIGLDTTARRPVVNTRDEPHADSRKYRRLHLIIGDANTFEISTFLKLGSTAAVLHLLEQVFYHKDPQLVTELARLQIADPISELREVSRDLNLEHRLRMQDGSLLTAVEVQREYLKLARAVATDDSHTQEVLKRWDGVLAHLQHDPLAAASQVEWIGKMRVLDSLRSRHKIDWDDARIQAANIHWADLTSGGLGERLRQAAQPELLITKDEAERAVTEPPADTRAWFRGRAVAKFGSDVAAAGWASIVLRGEQEGRLQRVPMTEPLRGTRELTEALLDASDSTAQLLKQLEQSH